MPPGCQVPSPKHSQETFSGFQGLGCDQAATFGGSSWWLRQPFPWTAAFGNISVEQWEKNNPDISSGDVSLSRAQNCDVIILLTHKCRNGNNKGKWQVNRGPSRDSHDVNGGLSPVGTPKPACFASSPLPSGIASGSPLSSWNLLTWLFWVFHKVWTSQNFCSIPWSRTQDKPAVSAQNQTEHWNPCVGTMVLECSQHMVLPLHQWSVGPARDQRCVLPKKTSAKMNMKAINSNHTQIFFRKKTYIYKNKNQSWNCFENVDNQQMLCFTTKRSLFYLSNFQPPRPAHGKHGNSIQQTLQPPHWQHHLSPVEFLARVGLWKNATQKNSQTWMVFFTMSWERS